jgi:hypothetical protein
VKVGGLGFHPMNDRHLTVKRIEKTREFWGNKWREPEKIGEVENQIDFPT